VSAEAILPPVESALPLLVFCECLLALFEFRDVGCDADDFPAGVPLPSITGTPHRASR